MSGIKNSKKLVALSIFKQSLKVNDKPFPWIKAVSAGIAAGLPILIGLLLGNIQYGLIAGLGGFSYLYAFNIPYAQRARKLFFVVITMTFLAALGTIVAPYPIAVAILTGLIGATSIFIFRSLRITGPSAIFFVLVFSMISGMPEAPELALLRAGLVFLGSALSWILAMIGWLFDPYGSEGSMIKKIYLELAKYIDSIDIENFDKSRHHMMSVLKEADETIIQGYSPWHETDLYQRLYKLSRNANDIFIYINEHFIDSKDKLPKELGEALRGVAASLDKKTIMPAQIDEKTKLLFSKVYDADSIINKEDNNIKESVEMSKLSLKTVFGGAFDKNSIVFTSAIGFGLITMIAAMIAFELELTRGYWIPLSCVAVMSGHTVVATHHRAIQRGIGTVIGVIIASLILAMEPSGYIIAFLSFLLTAITELFIVKNYGLAALFFTPNALLMAESTSTVDFGFTYFASARILNVIIGIIIGLIGVWLLGRKSAFSRIPHFISKTIRSQAQFLLVLFSEQGPIFNVKESKELKKMRINTNNLRMLYESALGEIPREEEKLDKYWPIVFSIEHLSYLLEECSKIDNRPILSDKELAGLLYACEVMSNQKSKNSLSKKVIPDIAGYSNIKRELMYLQEAIYNCKDV